MARLWHRQDRHTAFRLAAYWDDLVRQHPATLVPSSKVPPGDAAIIRQLHSQEEADTRRPAFEADLLQSLLATYGQEATVTVTASPPHQVPPAPRKHARSIMDPVRRYAMPALEIALIVALLLASIAGIWLTTSRNDGSRIFAPPVVATPDVPMARSNPARTGEMPGPGIDGTPVILNEFTVASGGYGSPALVGTTLYVNGGFEMEGIFAINTSDGSLRWSLDGSIWSNHSSAAVIDGTLYATDFNGEFVALDADTGTERWRVSGFRFVRELHPLIANGVAYMPTEDGTVHAIDIATGTPIWQQPLPGAIVTFSAFADGTVYLGTVRGLVHALDAENGTERWQTDVNLGSSTLDGIAVANGLVYVSANKPVRRADAGFATALDATTGEAAWRVDAEPRSGFTLLAVDENAVYLAGPDRLGDITAVDAMSGAAAWTTSIGSIVDGAPALVDGTIYFGTLNGVLHALDTASGAELWRMDFEGELGSTPIVAGGLLYIGTMAGNIYVIGGSDAESAVPAPAAGAIPGQIHRSITRNR